MLTFRKLMEEPNHCDLARLTGNVNRDCWRDFPPGTARIMGFRCRQTDGLWPHRKCWEIIATVADSRNERDNPLHPYPWVVDTVTPAQETSTFQLTDFAEIDFGTLVIGVMW